MKRVALYARVSTDEQKRHGYSIGAQVTTLRKYAKDHKYTVIGEYIDEGISARKSYKKRPALLRLLNEVQSDKVDIILFCKLDRWFRNVAAYYQVQPILDAHDVAWIATEEEYETVTSAGRFKVNIMLSVAEQEADRTAERIRFVFDDKRSRGEVCSGSVPMGFTIQNKHIIVNDPEMQIVKEAFAEYLNTRSVFKVKAMLLDKYHIQRSYVGMKRMLQNQVYAEHIGKDNFVRVQEILMTRSQRHAKQFNVYKFASLLYCKECGGRLKGVKPDNVKYYVCRKHSDYGNKICPNAKYHREDIIEQHLLSHVEDAIKDYNIRIMRNTPKPVDKAKIAKKMEKLKDLYLDDLITKDVYERDYRALESELESLSYAPECIRIEDVTDALRKYHELSETSQKAFWGRIVRRVEIDKAGEIFLTV